MDNNAYTNLMARENLSAAAAGLDMLRRTDPDGYDRLVNRLRIEPHEPEGWLRAAERMFVPYDERSGVLLQDEHFLNRKPWDFEHTPLDKYPLLLHYHPLNIYRHQVIKQTDVVLATFLAGDRFTREEKQRVFEYYDPLTTGDSSLSSCVQSVMAAEVGDLQAAYDYFLLSAAVDLANLAGNVSDGIHVASCGGVWMALVNGFAGLRDSDGGDLRFTPRLPTEWQGMLCRRTSASGPSRTTSSSSTRWRTPSIPAASGRPKASSETALLPGIRLIVPGWSAGRRLSNRSMTIGNTSNTQLSMPVRLSVMLAGRIGGLPSRRCLS